MPTVADLPSLLGEAPSFTAMLEHVSRSAPVDRPLLVIGERGTGKELIGARLHYLSRRWDRPFIRVNCAALSEDLLDSELFGHEAGAFTGAVRRHAGRFERADGGTLFLDEIAHASLRVQEKILRAVEYGEFERLGGSATQTADVRVIGATNVDLPGEVAAGRFRADLLDRLAFDVISLPPLRERAEDIPLLADHFGHAMARELGAAAYPGLTPAARDALDRHDWPGNVRELRNVVERAVVHAPSLGRPIPSVAIDPFRSPYRPPAPRPMASAAPPAAAPDLDDGPLDLGARVAAYEASLLRTALAANRHNRRRTADHLGLGYDQLRRLLRKHGIGGDA